MTITTPALLETKELPSERMHSKPNLRIPKEVERKDLDDSGLLYSPEVIQAIQNEFANAADNRYSKHQVREKLKKYGFSDDILKYAVIKNDNEFYIVYKGNNWSNKTKRRDPTGKILSFLAGTGSFGKVKILQKISSRGWYVAKISRTTPNEQEAEILKRMGLCTFEKEYISVKKGKQHHIIQPYLPDFDCLDAFETGKRFYDSKGRLIKFFLEMAKQVQKLHLLGYLHCDVKPENFRLDALTDSVTLIDMGLVLPKAFSRAKSGRGSLLYMAPEVNLRITNQIIYDEKVDVYSLYYTFLTLLTHAKTPFTKYFDWNNKLDHYKDQANPDFVFYKEFFKTVLQPMRQREATQRCSIDTCIQALEAMLRDYPLNHSHQEVDIHDFFAARDKKAFIAALTAFPGVNHIVDNKSHHTNLQHSEFQQALCEAGARIAHYTVGKSLMTAAKANDFSRLSNLLNSEPDLNVKTQMIKQVAQFYISENNATSLISFILLPAIDLNILIPELTLNPLLLRDIVKHEDAFNKIIKQAPDIFSYLNNEKTSLLHELVSKPIDTGRADDDGMLCKIISHLSSRIPGEEKPAKDISWNAENARGDTPIALAAKNLNWNPVKLLLTREKNPVQRQVTIQMFISSALKSPNKISILSKIADDLRRYGFLNLLNTPTILSLDPVLKTKLSKMFNLEKISAERSKRTGLFTSPQTMSDPNPTRETWMSIMSTGRGL